MTTLTETLPPPSGLRQSIVALMPVLSYRSVAWILTVLFCVMYNLNTCRLLLLENTDPGLQPALQTSELSSLQSLLTYVYSQIYLQKVLVFFLVLVPAYALLHTLMRQPYVFVMLWPLLCVAAGIAEFFTLTYGITITSTLVGQTVEATSREVDGFLGKDLLLQLIPSGILALAGIFLYATIFPRTPNTGAFWLWFGITLLVIVPSCFIRILDFRYSPYNFINPTVHYFAERWFSPNSVTDLGQYDARLTGDDKALNIVLVIGESARADHFHLNGYGRQTSPQLEHDAIISFPNTRSCGSATVISVPCLMTRADEHNLSVMYHETSLISVFKKAAFKSYWLGAQGSAKVTDRVTTISAEASERYLALDSKSRGLAVPDESLFPMLDQVLSDGSARRLIVLHMNGSHFPYKANPEAVKFKPVCAMPIFMCARDSRLINTYDNTIVYTDYFLDRVIAMLKNTNTLLVYVSDHGESLGENGRFVHGHDDAPENRQVPMFWWASAAFREAHPERIEALMEKKDKPASHHNIFHSILGCAGIESPLVDKSLSLCNLH